MRPNSRDPDPARADMSNRTRYQAQSVYAEHRHVTSYLGVDPVTGLPVLIYRSEDAVSPQLARLDSDHLPRLLAWRDDGDGGIMVVAWSSAFVPAGGQPLDNLQLLDSARALSDAAAAGVTHGDLTPERFLLAGDSTVLEGFGVPWQKSPASSEDDVRAWSASVRQLGHKGGQWVESLLDEIDAGADLTPAGLLARLTDVLLRKDPSERVAPAVTVPAVPDHTDGGAGQEEEDRSWDEFAEQAERARTFDDLAEGWDAGGQPEPAAGEPDPAADTEPDPEESDSSVFIPSSTYASERLVPGSRPAAREPEPESPGPKDAAPESAASSAAAEADAGQPDRAAETDRTAPVPDSLPAGGSSSYLKSLSSTPEAAAGRSVGVTGGSSRSSTDPEPDYRNDWPEHRTNRRTIMIIVLVVLSAVLITLLLVLRQRDTEQAPTGISGGVTYVIDVIIEPDDLPPVNVFVLESPAASQFGPNTALGTAPRRLILDAEGTWVFEGRFQGRISEPVTIQIPEERSSSVTITVPPEPAGEQ